MIYLTPEDLKTHTLERLLEESTTDFAEAADKIELQVIAEVKSMLGARYDAEAIFSGTARHPYLVKIITKMVTHDIIARNAARKVPQDRKDDYQWAVQQLEKMNTGKLKFADLPAPVQDPQNPGTPASKMLYGNLKKTDFYI